MKAALITTVLWITLLIVLGIGWILNIVKFVNLDFKEPYKAEIVRAIGIPIAPLGGVVGYMTIDDTPPKVTDTITSTK